MLLLVQVWKEEDEWNEEDDRNLDDQTEHFLSLKLPSHARSFMVIGYSTEKIMLCLCPKLSLLQVLDLINVHFNELPETILQLVNLRYLAINVNCDSLHRSISKLKNLQTLIVTKISIAVIFDLPQLRHIKISNELGTTEIRYENISDRYENLQSVSNMGVDILLMLREKLPELRKLGIYSTGSFNNVDLTSFCNLETLGCNGFSIKSDISNIIFPVSLRKLTLFCCDIPPSLLDAIGELPNLQVLKIVRGGFENKTWKPTEGGFLKLQHLQFTASGLKTWLACGEDHYPVLRHLVFDQCLDIDEIPSEIGEINTLELIEVDRCKPSVFGSALRIKAGQVYNGSDGLRLLLGNARKLVRIHKNPGDGLYNAAKFQQVTYSIDDEPEEDLKHIHVIYMRGNY